MDNILRQKNADKFICELCAFTCCKQSDYERHLSTRKHKKTHVDNILHIENPYQCQCGKKYKQRFSLAKHRKKCSVYIDVMENIENIEKIKAITETIMDGKNMKNYIVKLIEQNNEFKNLLLEQSKQLTTQTNMVIHNNNNIQNIHTTNNNNQFNLNFFLNEKCKDAINMMDFINSLEVSPSDAEYTGIHGYVEGITKIFMDGLKQMDIYKRPIHCTDLKRETLYIREENAWEKDNQEKTKFKKALNAVVRKNMMQIKQWQQENPNCEILDSNEYVLHLNIMRQSLGGGNLEKTERNNEKIMRNIAKHVLVDRKNL